jgi:hypothetical protein
VLTGFMAFLLPSVIFSCSLHIARITGKRGHAIASFAISLNYGQSLQDSIATSRTQLWLRSGWECRGTPWRLITLVTFPASKLPSRLTQMAPCPLRSGWPRIRHG